jgi:hypothetical protein
MFFLGFFVACCYQLACYVLYYHMFYITIIIFKKKALFLKPLESNYLPERPKPYQRYQSCVPEAIELETRGQTSKTIPDITKLMRSTRDK